MNTMQISYTTQNPRDALITGQKHCLQLCLACWSLGQGNSAGSGCRRRERGIEVKMFLMLHTVHERVGPGLSAMFSMLLNFWDRFNVTVIRCVVTHWLRPWVCSFRTGNPVLAVRGVVLPALRAQVGSTWVGHVVQPLSDPGQPPSVRGQILLRDHLIQLPHFTDGKTEARGPSVTLIQ